MLLARKRWEELAAEPTPDERDGDDAADGEDGGFDREFWTARLDADDDHRCADTDAQTLLETVACGRAGKPSAENCHQRGNLHAHELCLQLRRDRERPGAGAKQKLQNRVGPDNADHDDKAPAQTRPTSIGPENILLKK